MKNQYPNLEFDCEYKINEIRKNLDRLEIFCKQMDDIGDPPPFSEREKYQKIAMVASECISDLIAELANLKKQKIKPCFPQNSVK